MKAVIVQKPGEILMAEVKRPEAGPEDILIKVAYSGICGTDLSILDGDMSFVREGLIKYPVRIGHEWSGIVEETGPDVKGFKKGDRVVADNAVTCGICEFCKDLDFNSCINVKSVGTVNCWDGSFAEYILMPRRHVHKLPEQIGLEEAALIEPASIALSGLKKCDIAACSSILVVGTGPIGLAAVALAKNMGIPRVLLSGRKQYKLDIGKRMGADITVDITKESLQDAVRTNTGGKGVDAVVETSGNIPAVTESVNLLKTKGVLSLLGFYETDLDHFPIDKLVLGQLQIKGTAGEFGTIQEVIRLISDGLDLKPMITHRFGFDEAVEAIRTAKDKNDTKIKMMIEMCK